MEGEGGWLEPGDLVCHVLLVETDHDGLVLIDTGFGTRDVAARSLPWAFIQMAGVRLAPSETAIARVRALGFDPRDVRHVVPTHLDLDHAGGLPDFPWATVHANGREHAAAMRRSVNGLVRYRPEHWAHGPRWELYGDGGDAWFGLRAVPLRGLSADVALVPLRGHSAGHCGVAVRDDSGWLLHAGDAYASRHEVRLDPPYIPLGHALFHAAISVDRGARRHAIASLRRLPRDVKLFCAHDAVEWGSSASRGAP